MDISLKDLKNNIEEIQKKLDKYEQALFRIFNSEKGPEGQEAFVKYLTDSIEFYRARSQRLAGVMDNLMASSLFKEEGVGAFPTHAPAEPTGQEPLQFPSDESGEEPSGEEEEGEDKEEEEDILDS